MRDLKPETPCCAVCGQPLPATALGPVCPDCAFRGALELKPEAASRKTVAGGQSSVVRNQEGRARVFGDYELLEEIAHGGMGVVWKARQKPLNRIVALKVMLSGQFAQPQFVQRFRAEAEAIAQLQHPNIVAIHEVGEHEGQPYFTMDFVEGRTLAELVHDGPLPAQRAVTYLKAIAEAVQYAHQHGILHRDLKPSNVLIDGTDQPRITDFGLAKRLTSDFGPRTPDLTLTGQVLGTPNYLSPEQAAGRHAEVGRASDGYALGAMLYHLLTGRPPFHADSLTTLLREVIDTEPVSPRLLNASVPRDLETICLKCLEKEPSRRYASAQLLADELGRFLRGEPILARPVSRSEKVWRWCRRKPALASALGAVVLVAAVGFVGIVSQWRRADVQRDAAVQAQIHADQERYDAAISEAQLLIEKGRSDRAREILVREGQEQKRGWEWGWLQRLCNQDLMTLQHQSPVWGVAFSPDQRHLATASFDRMARLWDLRTGQMVRQFQGHRQQVSSVAFSPDGTCLLTASYDGTAQIWDVANGKSILVLTNGESVPEAVFSPNGKLIATAGKFKGARLWDSQDGSLLWASADHEQAVFGVAFSPDPDGRRLAWAGGQSMLETDADTTVTILDRPTDKRLTFKAHRQGIFRLRFSPDGKLLATASVDGTVRLWNTETGEEVSPTSATGE